MNEKQKEIRYIDLFGGVGGFRLGIERASDLSKTTRNQQRRDKEISSSTKQVILAPKQFTCVWYNDIDKYAVQTYNKNFKENWEAKDIRTIKTSEIPDFDLLCAGFPCQAFSIAGKRKGFEDTRGTLFYEIARILKAKRPKYFFLENVKGLLSHDRGRTFAIILSTLAELGYDVQWMVLNSKFFGVPQNRERVFIIGSPRGTSRPEILPIGKSSKEINNELEKKPIIIGTTKSDTAQGTNSRSWVHDTKGIIGAINSTEYKQPKQILGVPQSQIVKGTDGVSSTINTHGGGQGAKTGLYLVHNVYGGFKEKKMRKFKETSPTIRTPKGGGHLPMVAQALQTDGQLRKGSSFGTNNPQSSRNIRRLTPIECERLQGFPDNWTEGVSDTQRYKQMGNAVTVNVIQAIISKLLVRGKI